METTGMMILMILLLIFFILGIVSINFLFDSGDDDNNHYDKWDNV